MGEQQTVVTDQQSLVQHNTSSRNKAQDLLLGNVQLFFDVADRDTAFILGDVVSGQPSGHLVATLHCIPPNQCGPRRPPIALDLPLVHDKELELVLVAGTCDLVESLFKFLDSLSPFDLDYYTIAIAEGK